MKYYPLAINLKHRKVLVVGGGSVAGRKVARLLEAGAHIRIVSPQLNSQLSRLAKDRKVSWSERKVQKKDVHGASIVIAATDDDSINEKVSRWASEKRIWINVVDNHRLSDFISPALLRKRETIIAVYTDGKNPVLSRDLKNFLKENWNVFLSYRNRL